MGFNSGFKGLTFYLCLSSNSSPAC